MACHDLCEGRSLSCLPALEETRQHPGPSQARLPVSAQLISGNLTLHIADRTTDFSETVVVLNCRLIILEVFV